MKLMCASELNGFSDQELSALFARVSRELVCTRPGTPNRRNALGTLENIQRARCCCRSC